MGESGGDLKRGSKLTGPPTTMISELWLVLGRVRDGPGLGNISQSGVDAFDVGDQVGTVREGERDHTAGGFAWLEADGQQLHHRVLGFRPQVARPHGQDAADCCKPPLRPG